MNTITHNHIKMMMLSGLILIAGSWAETAHAADTTWISANHQLVIPDAEKVNGVYYLRSDRVANATMRADFSGVDLSSFKQWSASATLFRPGAHYFPPLGWTGFRNMPAPRSVNLALRVGGDMCGQTGDLGAEVSLVPKSSGNHTTLTATTRLHVAIDCKAPVISKINGTAPNRLNNTCLPPGGSSALSIEMEEDIGIRNVEISSDNPALSISPPSLASDRIRKASGRKFFTADFSMRATNTNPVNRVGITARVSDLAGHHKEYHFNVNLAGTASHAFRVNLTPLRPVTVGQRAAFGGTLLKQSCDRGALYMWQIIKVPTRTSTSTRSIVATSGSSWIRPRGPRTPFIAPFTPSHSGFYRLQLLEGGSGVAYTSPALEVRGGYVRTPHTTKKVSPKPARRRSGPGIQRRF